ncbi:hypothetical protein [Streptomyces cupreus]|uniref:hypothetical protein n=1 Tax=Streptomyces cupreus TaxID=2759956 RepID=UPI0021B4D0CA|nr:hypothetical protein [Streptomyces cupreus]
MLYRQVHGAPARLSDILPVAPPELLRTVHALLAKNPGDRPRDAAEAAGTQDVLASDAVATQMLVPVVDVTGPAAAARHRHGRSATGNRPGGIRG